MYTVDLNRRARLQKTMTIQWRGNSVIGRSTIQRMTDIRLLMVTDGQRRMIAGSENSASLMRNTKFQAAD
jgi:hypothetical protein